MDVDGKTQKQHRCRGQMPSGLRWYGTRKGIMDQPTSGHIELTVSDQSQLGALQKFLSWAAPDAEVSRIAGKPNAGEQGALDALAMIASSSGLVAAIRTLPEFLRSRRASLSVSMTIEGKPLTITAANVDEVIPILERLLSA